MKKLLLFVLIGLASQSFAQLNLQGEIRPRTEYRHGYKELFRDNKTYGLQVSQRSRLTLNYAGQGIKSCISLQDVRYWGEEQLKKDVSTINLHMAWFEFKFSDSTNLRLGRQELAYDNGRFISASGWNQNSSRHDAARFIYSWDNLKIDFVTAYNQVSDTNYGTFYAGKDYKTLNVLWISGKTRDWQLSSLTFAEGLQNTKIPNMTYMRATEGLIGKYSYTENLNATLRAFYQFGKTKTGQSIRNAYYGNVDVQQKLKRFSVTLGGEIISGNDATDKGDTKTHAMFMLYGSAHTFTGFIDYFATNETDMKNAGLINGYLKLNMPINKTSGLFLDYHYLSLQNKLLNPLAVNPWKKYLGSEIDFMYQSKINDVLTLEIGYAHILGTSTLEFIKGGNKKLPSNWAYIMLTYKPTFLKY